MLHKRCVRSAAALERRYLRRRAKLAACAVSTPTSCPGSLPAGSPAPAAMPADDQAAALNAVGFAKPRVKLVRARVRPSQKPPTPLTDPRGLRAMAKARYDSRPKGRHRSGTLPPVSKKFLCQGTRASEHLSAPRKQPPRSIDTGLLEEGDVRQGKDRRPKVRRGVRPGRHQRSRCRCFVYQTS
jgi:hypothetical protein